MRPTQEQLLASLRLSLSETVLPKVEDRWARYTAAAMDLVLQHLQLRLATESDALTLDNTDMLDLLGQLGLRAAELGRSAQDGTAELWAGLADLVHGAGDVATADGTGLRATTGLNEQLRARVVTVMHWLDEHDSSAPLEIELLRDLVYRLIRRQVDRVTPMVEPLFMSFSPTAAS